MSCAFVDTSFYLALIVASEQRHSEALGISMRFEGRKITSEFVLCELGALLSAPKNRPLFTEFVKLLDTSSSTEVIPASQEHFRTGLQLFSVRPDKAWSLTDCISFEIMKQRGVVSALAFDHHFEQAGYKLLQSADLTGGA